PLYTLSTYTTLFRSFQRLPRTRPQSCLRGDTMVRAAAHPLRKVIPFAALLPMALTVIVGYLGTVLWSFKTSLTNARSFPSDTFRSEEHTSELQSRFD